MDLEIVHTRLDEERAMRFRPPDDRKERKSSHGAKEIWNYSVMVLCRYAAMQFFRYSSPCNTHANARKIN